MSDTWAACGYAEGRPDASCVFRKDHESPHSCPDWFEDYDSFGIGHQCRLPEGHEGYHVCLFQGDDEDWCRW